VRRTTIGNTVTVVSLVRSEFHGENTMLMRHTWVHRLGMLGIHRVTNTMQHLVTMLDSVMDGLVLDRRSIALVP
jgi:hypothetical protein